MKTIQFALVIVTFASLSACKKDDDNSSNDDNQAVPAVYQKIYGATYSGGSSQTFNVTTKLTTLNL
ncbi:MAG: hypothetical protein JSS90_00145 [Bacteroidetes bacterium]|jgi:hypothetical protein|nr:hypothetical protein [Bacteroidota bacterium]